MPVLRHALRLPGRAGRQRALAGTRRTKCPNFWSSPRPGSATRCWRSRCSPRLAAKDPELKLDVLAPAWSRPVLDCMPEVAGIIESPFGHGELKLKERYRMGRALARNVYDCAIVLPNSFKSALVPFFADIPLRAGFVGEGRYGLLNVRHRLDKAKLPLMVERFAQLAEAPGAELPRPLPEPKLTVRPQAVNRALDELGLTQPARLAIFCPGAEFGPAKRWPARHFAALGQRLAADGYDIWMVGSLGDFESGREIAEAAGGHARNLCGKTTLAQAIALLSLADRVVTNDSGLMHIAAALDRPTAALFGSSSPEFTPPLSAHAIVIKHDIECRSVLQARMSAGALQVHERADA
ncbi:MAG: lipopolysaccharide heptosyltransferase II [Rhodospirillales bacterium]